MNPCDRRCYTRVMFKWETVVTLFVVHTRRPFPVTFPVSACVSSIGKIASFGLCQVDMYVLVVITNIIRQTALSQMSGVSTAEHNVGVKYIRAHCCRFKYIYKLSRTNIIMSYTRGAVV